MSDDVNTQGIPPSLIQRRHPERESARNVRKSNSKISKTMLLDVSGRQVPSASLRVSGDLFSELQTREEHSTFVKWKVGFSMASYQMPNSE